MPFECDCGYFWAWYYIWTVRSNVLKAGTALLIISFFLHVAALVTEYWLVGPDGYTGLFDKNVKGNIGDKPVPVPLVCPILGTLSAVILFFDNILNMLFATRRFHVVMPAVIVFSFIAALMLMTVIVTWSVPDVTMGQHLSWSFVIATVAVVVDMAGCGLCVMEFLSRRERTTLMDLSPRTIDLEEPSTELRSLNDSDSAGSEQDNVSDWSRAERGVETTEL